MEDHISLLETTLEMLGAAQYIPNFKRYAVDSSILPLLSEDDLKIIGVDDEQLRSKLIKQCFNLPLSDARLSMNVNENYLMKVLQETDRHLLLLDASLSYALNNPDIHRCDIKLHKAVECLMSCTTSFHKEFQSFHHLFAPKKSKRNSKLKLAVLTIISATATVFIFRRYFS